MTTIDELMTANHTHAASFVSLGDDPRPTRQLAVLTCMDARIDVPAALGLPLGAAHVLRNAGGRVTPDVVRSLALSSSVLGVTTVVIMQHTTCGLTGTTNAELRERTGADIDFLPIADQAASVRQDVELLAQTPFLSHIAEIAGVVYDVRRGLLSEVVRWKREA